MHNNPDSSDFAVLDQGFSLNGVDIVIHRPHPRKEADKGAVKSVRTFLINAGVKP